MLLDILGYFKQYCTRVLLCEYKVSPLVILRAVL